MRSFGNRNISIGSSAVPVLLLRSLYLLMFPPGPQHWALWLLGPGFLEEYGVLRGQAIYSEAPQEPSVLLWAGVAPRGTTAEGVSVDHV